MGDFFVTSGPAHATGVRETMGCFWGDITEVRAVEPHRWAFRIQGPAVPAGEPWPLEPIEANDSWFGYDSSTYTFYKDLRFEATVTPKAFPHPRYPEDRWRPALWKKMMKYCVLHDPAFSMHLPQAMGFEVEEQLKKMSKAPEVRTSVWDLMG